MFIFRKKPLNLLKYEEIFALFNNIELIFSNSDKILQNKEYRNIRVKGTGVDGIYIGHVDLLLGDLITLWNNDSPWRDEQKFYYHLGGSPLSGRSFCTYWKKGKIGCDKWGPSFWTLLEPAGAVIKKAVIAENPAFEQPSKRNYSDLNIKDLIEYMKQ